jgi:signal transduction histidine kinase
MWHSLRVRLLLSILLVVLIAVGVTALVATRRTIGEFQRYVERRPPVDERRLAYVLARTYNDDKGWANIQPEVERLGQFSAQRVVVADAAGTVIADSDKQLVGKQVDNHWRPPVAAVTDNGDIVGTVYVDPTDNRGDPASTFLAEVNRSVLAGALAAGLAAIVISFALASRILRPVEHLTDAAQRMTKGDLTVRVPVESADEIGQLADAFNTMAGTLGRQEQLRRNMVSDVAHELRTPLTNLRGYLEAARDGLVSPDGKLVDNLYEETMLLSRLVIDLQELAQAEAGQLHLQLQPVALSGIAEQAIDMLRPQADAKSIGLSLDVPRDLPLVNVDSERIGQVLRNLLNNAVAHTPPGGAVTVRASRTDGFVAVSVSDTGEGIAPEHLPHVFDRFYRADKSRARQTGGAGLGLAIVKQIILAHGGTVTVDSTPGAGSTFTFTLPVAQTG